MKPLTSCIYFQMLETWQCITLIFKKMMPLCLWDVSDALAFMKSDKFMDFDHKYIHTSAFMQLYVHCKKRTPLAKIAW